MDKCSCHDDQCKTRDLFLSDDRSWQQSSLACDSTGLHADAPLKERPMDYGGYRSPFRTVEARTHLGGLGWEEIAWTFVATKTVSGQCQIMATIYHVDPAKSQGRQKKQSKRRRCRSS